MKAQLEMITPQMAIDYMNHNTNNYRTLSMTKVKSMAADMKSGRWQANGETIVFSADGTLKDGQHRLKAIIESGMTVPILVVREVANNVNIFDCGGGRTIQQWGSASGKPISGQATAVAGIIVRGFRGSAPRGVLQDYITKNYDDLKEAARIAALGKKGGIGNKGSVALSVYVMRRLQKMNDENLESFFRIFNTGLIEKNDERDPSPALVSGRQFLTKIIGGGAAAQVRQFEVVMQALKDFQKNRNRKREYPYDEQMLEYLREVQRMDGFTPVPRLG